MSSSCRCVLRLAVLLVAFAAPAPARDEPTRVPGELLLDGRPWPGGRARLVQVDRETWKVQTGHEVEVVADEDGAFVVALDDRGPWRVHEAPGWPEGASVRCQSDTPRAPGRLLFFVGSADSCRVALVGASTPLVLELVSPIPIEGVVIDEAGAPVASARVEAFACPGLDRRPSRVVASRPVAPDGRFVLPVPAWLEGGRGLLVAGAPGLAQAGASLGLARDEEGTFQSPAPVTFVLGACPVACEGVVQDLDGRRLAGVPVLAELRLVDVCQREETVGLHLDLVSDAEGRFQFEAPGGSGWSSVGPAFARADLRVEADGQEAWADATFGPGLGPVVLEVEREGLPLAGVVLDAAGRPLPGARVLVGRTEARTDAAGRFALTGRERCDLAVLATGHAPRALRARLPAEDLVVRLTPAGPPITGRLLDAAGAPLAGKPVMARAWPEYTLEDGRLIEVLPAWPEVGVAVERPPASVLPDGVMAEALTRSDGSFTLGDLPPDAELIVEAPDVASTRARSGAAVELQLPPPTTVRARAVRAENASPLPVRWSAEVHLARGYRTETLEGSELEREVVGTELRLWISAPGRVSVWRVVALTGGTLDLGVLPLGIAGTVDLTVRWPEAPVRFVSVEWTGPAGERGGDGLEAPRHVDTVTARLEGLLPDAVELRCWAYTVDGRRLGPVDLRVDVRAGVTTPVEVDLRGLR
ncbi:MAG: carboxypeptidase-like regulatory domain-containing protein [Planctomycetes bacterium]|nr:carboxypeptidase-like regulatory domain-containing protein [Planctomycetota bacterium]